MTTQKISVLVNTKQEKCMTNSEKTICTVAGISSATDATMVLENEIGADPVPKVEVSKSSAAVKKRNAEKPLCCKMSNHDTKLIPNKILTGDKTYDCTVCTKRFNKLYQFRMHLKVHCQKEKFKCETCDKLFDEKLKLDKHVKKVHLTQRPYSCNECEKRFVHSASLRNHQKVHNDTRAMFQCDDCLKKFISKYNFTNHYKTHLVQKLYLCEKCGRMFSYVATLNRHMKSHKTKISWVCKLP